MSRRSRSRKSNKRNSKRSTSRKTRFAKSPARARSRSRAKVVVRVQPKKISKGKKPNFSKAARRMSSAASKELEDAKYLASALALPELYAPVRLPTPGSSRKTAVFGPCPRTITKDLGVTTPVGSPVVANGQVFTAITDHPHVAEISHITPGKLSFYVFQNTVAGVQTTSFTPPIQSGAQLISSTCAIKTTQATPDATDAAKVHGDRYVCPKGDGRRWMWIGPGQSVTFASSAGVSFNFNLWMWDGDKAVLQNPSPMVSSAAFAAGTTYGFTNNSTGAFFSWDCIASGATTLTICMINKTYSGGAITFTNLPSYLQFGSVATNNFSQEMFSFRTLEKLTSFIGSYDECRINSASLRFTCVGTQWTNGGSIDQVQLPLGQGIDDLLDDIQKASGDAVTVLGGYPGRRYERGATGTYAPIVADGPKCRNYKECIDISASGVINDIWWDLEKRLRILAAAASSAPPTSSTPANQMVIQEFFHMEGYCSNQAFPTDISPYSEASLRAADKLLQVIRVVTENPTHIAEILKEVWGTAQPVLAQAGPAMMMFGAGKGPAGAALSAAGAFATMLGQLRI